MRVTQYRKKRKYRRIILVLITLLCIAAVLGAVYFLFYTYKIEVTGNTYSSETEIKKNIQEDKLSVNTLYLLWKYKFSKPALLPYVESMDCTLKAPWSVKITVNEKKIVAGILFNNQYVYFDKDGLVILITDQVLEGITQVEGIEVSSAELYKVLPVSDKEVFKNIISVAKVLKKYEMTPDKIVCAGADINLYFGNVCVQLGKENYEEKIAQIPPIMEKLNGEGGTLHLEHFGQGSETISFVKGDIFAAPNPDPVPEDAQAEDQADQADQGGEEDTGQYDESDGSNDDNGEDSQDQENYDDSGEDDQNQ